jgi:acyl carrier protein
MIPAGIEFLDTMPTNSNGKIDRSALPKPSTHRREINTDYATPEEQFQIELTKIWEEVLNIEGLGIDDNFFEAGGHSLTAMQIISRIRETFSTDIPIGMKS